MTEEYKYGSEYYEYFGEERKPMPIPEQPANERKASFTCPHCGCSEIIESRSERCIDDVYDYVMFACTNPDCMASVRFEYVTYGEAVERFAKRAESADKKAYDKLKEYVKDILYADEGYIFDYTKGIELVDKRIEEIEKELK